MVMQREGEKEKEKERGRECVLLVVLKCNYESVKGWKRDTGRIRNTMRKREKREIVRRWIESGRKGWRRWWVGNEELRKRPFIDVQTGCNLDVNQSQGNKPFQRHILFHEYTFSFSHLLLSVRFIPSSDSPSILCNKKNEVWTPLQFFFFHSIWPEFIPAKISIERRKKQSLWENEQRFFQSFPFDSMQFTLGLHLGDFSFQSNSSLSLLLLSPPNLLLDSPSSSFWWIIKIGQTVWSHGGVWKKESKILFMREKGRDFFGKESKRIPNFEWQAKCFDNEDLLGKKIENCLHSQHPHFSSAPSSSLFFLFRFLSSFLSRFRCPSHFFCVEGRSRHRINHNVHPRIYQNITLQRFAPLLFITLNPVSKNTASSSHLPDPDQGWGMSSTVSPSDPSWISSQYLLLSSFFLSLYFFHIKRNDVLSFQSRVRS